MNSSLKLFVLSGEDEKLVIHSVSSFMFTEIKVSLKTLLLFLYKNLSMLE